MIEAEIILQRGDLEDFEVRIQTATHVLSIVPFKVFDDAAAFALNGLCNYRKLLIGDKIIQDKWREWLIKIGQRKD